MPIIGGKQHNTSHRYRRILRSFLPLLESISENRDVASAKTVCDICKGNHRATS